jgi:hypothetical protein
VSPHHQKIFLDQEYPCPCHPNGKLQQIVLTEAFGCDRCHRIFVLHADGLTIEELAATYPYKRRYYWNGQRFHVDRSKPSAALQRAIGGRSSLVLWLQLLGIIALVLVLFRLYSRSIVASPTVNLVLSIAIAIIVIIVIMLWLFDQG